MLMPTLFRDNWFDDFMYGFPELRTNPKEAKGPSRNVGLMRSDIKETEEGYEIDMELPGFKKEDVKAQVKDGYLTIEAESRTENEEKDEEGKYLRRERFVGSCRRSFFVGEEITEEDIKAKFEDGVLKMAIPKKQPVIEEPKYIAIEG